MEKKQLEFWTGPMGSLVPFVVFLMGTIYVCIKGTPTETGMALFALTGLTIGAFLVKNCWDYSEEIFVGMADPIVVVSVLRWLITGFFGVTLKSPGLVNGSVWVASQVHLTGGVFCVMPFTVCIIYASATGTSTGIIIPCMAVIHPADVIIGASPAVLVDVIMSGGCFGDNLVPVSDTTITSAKINNAVIGDVVRSYLKYTLVTTAIACVLFLIFGGGEMQSQAENARIMTKFATPKTLPMILPAVLVIFLAMRGHHLVEFIAWGNLFTIVEALAPRLLKSSDSLLVADGAPQGILVNGVSGMFGLCILAVLLTPMAHLFDRSGLLAQLRGKSIERLITTRKEAEVSVLLIMGLFDTMINFSMAAMLAVGSTFIEEIGKKFDISGVCLADLMDCNTCTVSYLLPYMTPLVAVTTVPGEAAAQCPGLVPQVAANQAMFTAFYLIVMIATALFVAPTGWGSKDEEKVKS